MSTEYDLLESQHNWNADDFKKANLIAFNSSFIPHERKKNFWSEADFEASLK